MCSNFYNFFFFFFCSIDLILFVLTLDSDDGLALDNLVSFHSKMGFKYKEKQHLIAASFLNARKLELLLNSKNRIALSETVSKCQLTFH